MGLFGSDRGQGSGERNIIQNVSWVTDISVGEDILDLCDHTSSYQDESYVQCL
jgi:hypothetical protein